MTHRFSALFIGTFALAFGLLYQPAAEAASLNVLLQKKQCSAVKKRVKAGDITTAQELSALGKAYERGKCV